MLCNKMRTTKAKIMNKYKRKVMQAQNVNVTASKYTTTQFISKNKTCKKCEIAGSLKISLTVSEITKNSNLTNLTIPKKFNLTNYN